MQISCDSLAQAVLNISEIPEVQEENPLYSWNLQIFRINRILCLYISNLETRYASVIYNFSKNRDFRIQDLLLDEIRTQMETDGFSEQIIAPYFDQAGQMKITKTNHSQDDGLDRVLNILVRRTEPGVKNVQDFIRKNLNRHYSPSFFAHSGSQGVFFSPAQLMLDALET